MSLLDTASLICTPNGYKEGKLYSVIPSDGSGDMSVTRATTATRVNSAGLVELVPYNILQRSQEFNTSPWISTATITPNATTAPDGTMTADRIQLLSSVNGYVYQGIGNAYDGKVVTISCWIKGATAQNIGFSDGSAYPNQISITTEWQRYTFTFTFVGGGIQFDNYFGVSPSQQAKDFYIWGAQLVEGSVAKDYQKTETRLNIPRLDYSNGTCPSLLVEPQRTNLLTYSENLTQWNQINQIASRQLVANPLTGVNNATKITRASVGTDPYVGQIVSAGNGTYTYSVYLWTDAGQPTDITLFMYNSSVSEVYTLDVTLTTTPTRYEFDATFANTGGTITVRIDLINSTDQYIYAYGAQLEANSSYATSYIPTTSASVTRNADVISKTGISSLIGQTEGTLFWYVKKNLGENDTRLNISDGTTNNWLFVGIEFDNRPRIYCNVGGVNQFNIYGTQVSNDFHKIAFAYKANDFALYIDGVQALTHSSGSVPTCSRLDLAIAVPTFAAFTTALTNAAALWKTRLTNSQLAALTTI